MLSVQVMASRAKIKPLGQRSIILYLMPSEMYLIDAVRELVPVSWLVDVAELDEPLDFQQFKFCSANFNRTI